MNRQRMTRITPIQARVVGCVAGVGLSISGAGALQPQPETGVSPAAPQPASAQVSTEVREADAAWRVQDWDAAADAYAALAKANPGNPTIAFRHAFALHSAGRYDEAFEAHLVAARFARLRGIASYNAACAAARMGQRDRAFTMLDQAFAAGFRDGAQIVADADLDSLHDDERWTRFAEAVQTMARGHALAFWVGSWEVRNAQGELVGTNLITSEQNGNVIREEWTDVGGGGGTSITFLDWRTGLWRHVWVDGVGGLVEIAGGVMPDGTVVFEGERVPAPNVSIPSRTTFSLLSDGRVRQLIETSDDDGQTWGVGFDGYYTKVQPESITP